MKVSFGFMLCVFVFLSGTLVAQNAATNTRPEGMDGLMALSEKSTVRIGEALEQIALLAGSEPRDAQAALSFLAGKGIVSTDIALDAVLTRGCLAAMIMKTKGWGGGIMYSIFGGGRYAWRELVYRNVMQAGGSEHSPVSGGELLAVIGRAAGDVELKME
ncbi:MAG TPA: hypothetical protein PK297_08095 [Spirochaetota bacterium]|nr:hypothetical protein [Spirochaetota bacterium]